MFRARFVAAVQTAKCSNFPLYRLLHTFFKFIYLFRLSPYIDNYDIHSKILGRKMLSDGKATVREL